MKVLGLVACILLSGCAVAALDPAEFEARARHVERSYDAPFAKLYECSMEYLNASGNQKMVFTPTRAWYQKVGYSKLEFIPLTPNRTNVRASGLGAFDPPESFFPIVDKCQQELIANEH